MRMIIRSTGTALLALLLAAGGPVSAGPSALSPPAASPATSERKPDPEIRDVSDRLAAIIEKHKIPAMAAVVIRDGRTVARGVAGVRKSGHDAKATLDDLWHLGSCTKSMTATLCAAMVERGTLGWDSTLAEVFADLEPSMHDDYKRVTLSQLLTNRGGVPGGLNFGGLWDTLWNFTGTPTEARRLLARRVLSRPPEYAPGTKSVYSNGGFAIAGHMAETAAGRPYEELMGELLFEPLGMTSCGWGSPGSPAGDADPDQPWGHSRKGEPVEPRPKGADNPTALSPAGRLHCTIGDWAKYVALHCRAGASNPQRSCLLLRPESFDRLHTPPDTLSDYAFGWARPERPWAGPEGSRYVLTHSGSNTMWFCVTWIAPTRDFAVLVCCNSGVESAGRACDEACAAMIRGELRDGRTKDN
ncbi:MAG: serine hydrolase domain-containing protein [Phycisphaerales bacterium]